MCEGVRWEAQGRRGAEVQRCKGAGAQRCRGAEMHRHLKGRSRERRADRAPHSALGRFHLGECRAEASAGVRVHEAVHHLRRVEHPLARIGAAPAAS